MVTQGRGTTWQSLSLSILNTFSSSQNPFTHLAQIFELWRHPPSDAMLTPAVSPMTGRLVKGRSILFLPVQVQWTCPQPYCIIQKLHIKIQKSNCTLKNALDTGENALLITLNFAITMTPCYYCDFRYIIKAATAKPRPYCTCQQQCDGGLWSGHWSAMPCQWPSCVDSVALQQHPCNQCPSAANPGWHRRRIRGKWKQHCDSWTVHSSWICGSGASWDWVGVSFLTASLLLLILFAVPPLCGSCKVWPFCCSCVVF